MITCPYCELESDDPDDCYESDEYYECECPHCENNFAFMIDYSPDYTTNKAPCLNGGVHNYEKIYSYPPTDGMRCSHCGKEVLNGDSYS